MKKLKIFFFCSFLLATGCKKFLDQKPDDSLAVPNSLSDLQALLDHFQILNFVDGIAAEVSATDYYLTDADFAIRNEFDQGMYSWSKQTVFPEQLNEWFYNYRAIYRANSVLEFSDNIQDGINTSKLNNIRGQAYFYRAKNFLKSLYVWSPSYDAGRSVTDAGVPIRLSTDFNEVSVRSSVEVGYSQVIADLEKAGELLPINQVHVMRPGKAAAYALLARTYLSMNKYEEALKYSTLSLNLKSDLLDFNMLSQAASFPIPQFNAEILHDSFMPGTILSNARAKIDEKLIALYAENDLRKVVYFKNNGNGTYGFKGSYEGSGNLFSGIATDEVYLIQSECLARAGEISAALNVLNKLLILRYKAKTFVPISATDQKELIKTIITERRKELVMRGIRWMDIKRLNNLGDSIGLIRNINGKVFSLAPNDSRFALPIPEDIISLSGILQNRY